jgi:hypothetical protein
MDGVASKQYSPFPSNESNEVVVKTMNSIGAAIESSQWFGWAPAQSSCPKGRKDSLSKSHFTISNVRVMGAVKQGPEPTKCPGHVHLAARSSAVQEQLKGILPPGSLTHFCVVTGWDQYNDTMATYSKLLGQAVPEIGIAGGIPANGTYLGKQLTGTTKIAFMDLNSMTRMEFLAGDPDHPSWWRDVFNKKGYEIHHMGYQLNEPLWEAAQKFEKAGLGKAVQWARWGNEKGPDAPGSGCYAYIDTQDKLGVTAEILANGEHCDSLPAPSELSTVVV